MIDNALQGIGHHIKMLCMKAYPSSRAASFICNAVIMLLQILEAERQALIALPASEVADWQDRRHRAAVKVQAHWRGLVQRRKLAMRSPGDIQREQVGTVL